MEKKLNESNVANNKQFVSMKDESRAEVQKTCLRYETTLKALEQN